MLLLNRSCREPVPLPAPRPIARLTARLTARAIRRLIAGILIISGAAAPVPEGLPAGWIGPRRVAAQEPNDGARVVDVKVGFEGKYKLGFWTPVRITLDGGARGLAGNLELVAPDGDGVLAAYGGPKAALHLAPGERRTLTRYARFGRSDGRLAVRVRDADSAELELEHWCGPNEIAPALSATSELFVSLGPGIGVEDVLANNLRAGRHGMAAARLTDPAAMPDHWCGYEGVDVLVLSTSEPRWLAELGTAQFRAIEQAVRMGGRLLWCVGSRGEEVFGEDSRWRQLAPGPFEGLQRLRDTTTLESYAGAMKRLDAVPGFSRTRGLDAAVFAVPRVRVELSQTASGGIRVPLLIRYPLSFGQVMLVTLDLDQPPIREWEARPRLVAGILRDTVDNRTARSSESGLGQVTHVGYDDLVGQLRGALDQFPGVTLVAFSWVAVLVGVYILMIGPGDYFLVRRLLGRTSWSWVTFPLVALLFTLLAWTLAGRVRESSMRLNQVDVLDFDTTAAFGRTTTWTHVYSPRAATYSLQLPRLETQIPEVKDASSLLSWQGLPGQGLGGMGNAAAVGQFTADYRIRAPESGEDRTQGAIEGVPIPVSGTKSLMGRRCFDWPNESESDLNVRFESNLLSGKLTNPLPVTLTGCSVLYGDWVYDVRGDVEPGAEIDLDLLPTPRVLEWRLTRRRVVEQEAVSRRWDALQIQDTARILEIMMFHRAAGGQSYTELSHRYQGFLDLSEPLQTGKAILTGRGADPAPGLTADGRELDDHYRQRLTFYRVMFSVDTATPRGASAR